MRERAIFCVDFDYFIYTDLRSVGGFADDLRVGPGSFFVGAIKTAYCYFLNAAAT